jgi:hypothetical protein
MDFRHRIRPGQRASRLIGLLILIGAVVAIVVALRG